MKYDKLPYMYKQVISKEKILSLYQKDTYTDIELDEHEFYEVEDYLAGEFEQAISSINLEGPDDFSLSAYLTFHSYKRDKEAYLELSGSFRFCVYGCEQYGKKAFATLRKAISSYKYKGFSVDELYQPENSVGISFDAIQQTDDMIYIGGHYSFGEYDVDIELPTNKKFVVNVQPDNFYGIPLELTITAPRDSTEAQLKEIVIDKYEEKLLVATEFVSFDFTDYSDEGTNYIECIVKLLFNDSSYFKVYLNNGEWSYLKLNDEASARIAAWEQILEDLEVEDVTRFS